MTDLGFEEELQGFADEFPVRMKERHEMGAVKYGPVRFLSIDSLEMMIEEVVDIANYALYTYIKLRMMQKAMEDAQEEPPPDGFTGSLRKG